MRYLTNNIQLRAWKYRVGPPVMDRDNGDLPLDLGVPNFRKTQLIQDFHPECSGSKKNQNTDSHSWEATFSETA